MAQQIINIGTTPDDGRGDKLRVAFTKTNANFAELYAGLLPSYTVATLPAGTLGARATVSDATAPTFLGALTGGGTVKTPVFHNGTAWVAG